MSREIPPELPEGAKKPRKTIEAALHGQPVHDMWIPPRSLSGMRCGCVAAARRRSIPEDGEPIMAQNGIGTGRT